MNINIYKEEFYKIIENNSFDDLPSQELIDSDERVALAVWKNYKADSFFYHDYYHEEDKYKIDWKIILDNYKDDVDFWKKAKVSLELLSVSFSDLFPNITQKLLKDKEYIVGLINGKKNNVTREYLELLDNLDGDKVKVKKDILLNSNMYISKEDMKEFEDDKDFVIKAVYKSYSNYDYLSEEDKKRQELIDFMASNKYSFTHLAKGLQEKNLDKFLSLHKSLSPYDIKNLSDDLKKMIVKKSNDLNFILPFLNNNRSEFKPLILNLLKNNSNDEDKYNMSDFRKLVVNCDNGLLVYLFGDNLKEIKPILEHWIDVLPISKLTKEDEKIIKLISLDFDLSKKLNNSQEYRFSKMKYGGFNVSFEDLKEYAYDLLKRDDLSKEKISNNIHSVKQLLPIDVLKELKIPGKDKIYAYFSYQLLQENIMVKEDTKKGNKI